MTTSATSFDCRPESRFDELTFTKIFEAVVFPILKLGGNEQEKIPQDSSKGTVLKQKGKTRHSTGNCILMCKSEESHHARQGETTQNDVVSMVDER